jgi:nucleoside-diphosphate-sugar epimerase
MGIHCIVGAGQVGSRLAELLVQQGHSVRQLSRSGTHVAEATGVQVNAMDGQALRAATDGADVIYNCLNPAYHRWPQDWPTMADNLLAAAQDRVLVTLSNLYGYGPVTAPMTEKTPLQPTTRKGTVRATMWLQALAAHQAGRLRTVEVRASDYIGEGGEQVVFGERVVPRIQRGASVTVLGRADVAHTWTYTGDVAETLARVATDEQAYGQAWHVPSNEPRTQTEVVTDLATVLEVPTPKIRTVGRAMLRAGGLVNPSMRELVEMLYEFDRPFIMDSSQAQTTFGLKPTPWDIVIEQTAQRAGTPS